MTEEQKDNLRKLAMKIVKGELNVTVAFPDPNTHAEWCKESPNFQHKEVNLKAETIVNIEPYQWGTEKGYKVYFNDYENNNFGWHFVVKGLPGYTE